MLKIPLSLHPWEICVCTADRDLQHKVSCYKPQFQLLVYSMINFIINSLIYFIINSMIHPIINSLSDLLQLKPSPAAKGGEKLCGILAWKGERAKITQQKCSILF